jgi:hypothetical protein
MEYLLTISTCYRKCIAGKRTFFKIARTLLEKRSLEESCRNKPTESLAYDEMSQFLHNSKTAQSNLKRLYHENAALAVNLHIDKILTCHPRTI